MKTINLSNSTVSLSDTTVKIKGELTRIADHALLSEFFATSNTWFSDKSSCMIDVSQCVDCVSMLLKVVLQGFIEFPKRFQSIHLIIGMEEGEAIPWHETLSRQLNHYKGTDCQILVQRVELV